MESWRIILLKELRNVRKENGWIQVDVAEKQASNVPFYRRLRMGNSWVQFQRLIVI